MSALSSSSSSCQQHLFSLERGSSIDRLCDGRMCSLPGDTHHTCLRAMSESAECAYYGNAKRGCWWRVSVYVLHQIEKGKTRYQFIPELRVLPCCFCKMDSSFSLLCVPCLLSHGFLRIAVCAALCVVVCTVLRTDGRTTRTPPFFPILAAFAQNFS